MRLAQSGRIQSPETSKPMSLTVVHVNNPDGWDLYVGRRVVRAREPRCHVDSVFRNGYRIGGDVLGHPEFGTIHDLTREQCVELFDWWLDKSDTPRAARILEAIPTIPDGHRLGCWCASPSRSGRQILTATDPEIAVCHGQILARKWEILR